MSLSWFISAHQGFTTRSGSRSSKISFHPDVVLAVDRASHLVQRSYDSHRPVTPLPTSHFCGRLWSLISAIRRETFAPFHSNQTVAIKAVPHGLQRRRVEPPRRAPAAAREAGVDGKNPFQGKKLTLGVTRDLPLLCNSGRTNSGTTVDH